MAEKSEKDREPELSQEKLNQDALQAYYRLSAQVDTSIRVGAIRVHGASRTRPDFMEKIVAPVLLPTTVGELIKALRQTASKLKKSEIFDHVDVQLDDSVGGEPSDKPIDVVITLKEAQNSFARTGLEVGNGEVNAYALIKLPSMLGGGETFETKFAVGNRTSSKLSARLAVPIDADPDKLVEAGIYRAVRTFVPASSFEEAARGAFLKYSFLSRLGCHELSINAAWRDIRAEDIYPRYAGASHGSGEHASISVQSAVGRTLKTSITHKLTQDTRDCPLLPTRGHLLSLSQEFAGLGGDIRYAANEAVAQLTVSPGLRCSVTSTTRAGLLVALNQSNRLNDRYFLGGPWSVRGFRYAGLGPRDGGDAVGGDVYWSTGASLLVPLTKPPAVLPLYGHAWVNAGTLLSLEKSENKTNILKTVFGSPSASAGVGIVSRVQDTRIEANLSIPISVNEGDKLAAGIDFSFGLDFM